jgi:transcriptional regulator with XRE-family HTH domain
MSLAKSTARKHAVPDPASVGGRLRALRKQKQMTLNALSERSGVALSTLSKMELGQVSASYEKLALVARGLGVEIAQLFRSVASARNRKPPAPRAVRSVIDDAPRYDTENYDLRMLATAFPGKRMTPAWGRIAARRMDEFTDFVRHPGQEFTIVLSGSVRIVFETGEEIALARHESAYFDSGVGHVYLSTSRQPAELLVVMAED